MQHFHDMLLYFTQLMENATYNYIFLFVKQFFATLAKDNWIVK